MRKYMADGVTDASAEIFSGLVDFRKNAARIMQKKNPFVYPSSDIITVLKGTVISLDNSGVFKTFFIDVDTDLSAGSLDTGAGFTVGADYYVYLCDDGGNGALVMSANSTYPLGYSAQSSRKIGGFHYGLIRCTNDKYVPVSPNGTVFGSDGIGWKQNVAIGIIPNSVWDLHNRPLCSPDGMVLVGNIWVDIYQSSVAEAIGFETGSNGMAFAANGKLQSKYGQLPATGSEGLNWYSFGELAARSGKRLLTCGEWIRAAYGNPGGQDGADDYGWTKTANGGRSRTGGKVNSSGIYDPALTIKRFAVSAHNLCDCVGNAWEWVDEMTTRPDGNWTWDYRNELGVDKGQAYLQNSLGVAALVCGGYWGIGVQTGARAVALSDRPWGVSTNVGCRLACDKLAG